MTSFPKAVLKAVQDIVAFIRMIYDLATCRRQGNRSVVGSLTPPFLKSGLMLALFQSSV